MGAIGQRQACLSVHNQGKQLGSELRLTARRGLNAVVPFGSSSGLWGTQKTKEEKYACKRLSFGTNPPWVVPTSRAHYPSLGSYLIYIPAYLDAVHGNILRKRNIHELRHFGNLLQGSDLAVGNDQER
jgi:hypothetical protein